VIAGASVLVVQGELPAATTLASIRVAHRHGVRTIVNLAPVQDLVTRGGWPTRWWSTSRAGQILDRGIDGIDAAWTPRRSWPKECASVVVTLGALGAVVASGSRVTHFPAAVVSEVVDTTGAGDAFVGVLARCAGQRPGARARGGSGYRRSGTDGSGERCLPPVTRTSVSLFAQEAASP